MPDEPVINIEAEPCGRKGMFDITLKLGGRVVHRDKIDPAKEADRSKFIKDVTVTRGCAGIDPESLNSELSAVGCSEDEGGEKKESALDILLELAENAYLFHTEDDRAYATIPVENHSETWPINSRGFRRLLEHGFYLLEETLPTVSAMEAVLNILESRALFDGEKERVYVRVAELGYPWKPTLYLDLCNAEWECVQITPDGWEVLPCAHVPVKFARHKGMLELPAPERGGSVDDLRPFVNVASDSDFRLLLGTLAMYFRPRGPYPVLAIGGEQGSAKSTTVRVIRSLIDPNKAPLRSAPRDERDLMIAASNGWLETLDNASSLPVWLSDALCRLSTGGGLATRTLYSNDEETIFDATRPIILNGIESLTTRGDLIDRSVILTLPRIPDENRQEEEGFWLEFEAVRAQILGALLDGVAGALRRHLSVNLTRAPRMADFARWGEAFGRALGWGKGEFLDAYAKNRGEANEVALEASIVASTVLAFVNDQKNFEGSASELLERLGELVPVTAKHGKSWPNKPNVLSGQLKRIAPTLRRLGVEIEFVRTSGRRTIKITNTPDSAREPSSRLSPSSPADHMTEPDGPVAQSPAVIDGCDPALDCDRHPIVMEPSPLVPHNGESNHIPEDNLGQKDPSRDGDDDDDDHLEAMQGHPRHPKEVFDL